MRFVLAFLLVTSTAVAQTAAVAPKPTVEQTIEADRVRLWNAAPQPLRVKLDAPIKALVAKSDVKPKPGEPPVDLFVESKKLATGVLTTNASQFDVEVLAMLVLFQAARAAEDDLRALLEEMKKTNDEKKAMRAYVDDLKARIAAAQERQSALARARSKLLKKFSDTSGAIMANMK